jgi:general stress protein CsbA
MAVAVAGAMLLLVVPMLVKTLFGRITKVQYTGLVLARVMVLAVLVFPQDMAAV